LVPYLLDVPDPPRPLELAEAFGNDHPVEVEVGFGKGLFLLTASEMSPGTNFLGVEIVRKYQLFTATRMAVRRRRNVRVVCADARLFLRDCLSAASVRAVHVYFPDPWWKTRHHKRRVFTAEFVATCGRVLRPGGRLHVATDVPEYFQVMTALMARVPGFRVLPPPPETAPAHDMDYLTNFERKFRRQGKPIHRAVYERGEVSALQGVASDAPEPTS
jgi:tRNA (guanine-N7-)-methyltransferase